MNTKTRIHWSWFVIWSFILGLAVAWWQMAGFWYAALVVSFSGVVITLASKADDWRERLKIDKDE